MKQGSRDVWMVNQYAITPDLPGGSRHFDLASELIKQGFRVRIFASDVNLSLRRSTKLKGGELHRSEIVDGVEFVWVKAMVYEGNNWRRVVNMLTFSRNFIRVSKLFSKQTPCVIIGSSPHPFAALAAQYIARKKKVAFILELRDLWPQALVDMGGLNESQLPIKGMRAVERYLYRRSKRFVVLAKGSIPYLVHRGVDRSRITFIPNGVRLEGFRPGLSREEARRQQGFNKFTIVYTGAHGPANALDTILHAARQLSVPIDFVLVGDGPAKEGLISLKERLGLTNVQFREPVPKDEIPTLLEAADAAVITLRDVRAFEYGISPNKLFDYMAAGKPVICSVPGDMAHMVDEAGVGITVQPEAPGELAHAVERLTKTSDSERRAMGARGRSLIKREFSREVLGSQLGKVINDASMASG